MTHDDIILHRTKDLQRRMFRVATDPMRFGLTLKAIAFDSGIPETTLRTYSSGAAGLPFHCFRKLAKVLPDELLSIMLSEDEKAIVSCSDDGDHDTIAATCIDYAGAHVRARHPESECGVDIGPGEHVDLTGKRAQLRAA